MYDRTTESLWQQFTGEAIVGALAGEELTSLPSSLVSFADFRASYPDGVVLSRQTGHTRDYGRNPYVGYDTIGQSPFMFKGEVDGRLPAMERVVAISLKPKTDLEQAVAVAYPFSLLSKLGVINDTQNDRELVIFHTAGASSALDDELIAKGEDIGATGVFDPHIRGQKLTFIRDGDKILDQETGSRWNILGQAISGPMAGQKLPPIVHGNHFWFAWVAFQPKTILYKEK